MKSIALSFLLGIVAKEATLGAWYHLHLPQDFFTLLGHDENVSSIRGGPILAEQAGFGVPIQEDYMKKEDEHRKLSSTILSDFKFSNDNIHQVVNAWFSHQSEIRAMFGDIGEWDVSGVTDMSSLFYQQSSFNDNIENWDTSKVTDMSRMFSGASSFNQPLNAWDTSRVTKMVWMFSEASLFNQPLDDWDASRVADMSFMFLDALSFSQQLCWEDLNTWSQYENMFGNTNDSDFDPCCTALSTSMCMIEYTADTYIRGGSNSNAHYGGATYLPIKNNGFNSGYTREVILEFDLTDPRFDTAMRELTGVEPFFRFQLKTDNGDEPYTTFRARALPYTDGTTTFGDWTSHATYSTVHSLTVSTTEYAPAYSNKEELYMDFRATPFILYGLENNADKVYLHLYNSDEMSDMYFSAYSLESGNLPAPGGVVFYHLN